MIARLRDWLTRAHSDRMIVLLAMVLLLPALTTGLSADDYLHTIMLDRPSPIEGFQRAPLDLFRFCDPHDFPALLRQGLFSWWDDPHAELAFFRPLTAATHALDHALSRNGGVWMHLHSALWTLLLLLGVRALYRELIEEQLLANLALALYALDDARGWLVSWVAARNAAIATGLSVWALVFHGRARRSAADGGGWAGPLLFACSLAAGEGALAIFGYLLGYALFLERGSVRARLTTLWPYLAIVVVWRVVYRALGYGAYGSAIYLDPVSEPIAFLKVFFEHGPVLLGAQLGGMWSDASTLLFALPRLELMIRCVTWLFILWVGLQMWQQLRNEPLSRFAALGALSALLPAAAVSPIMDRLLTWVGVGASILLAQLIAPLLRSSPPSAASDHSVTRGAHATALLLLIVHLANAALLPARARGNLIVRDILDRAAAAVPRDPSIVDKTLIFVNPPFVPYAGYLPIERAAQGIPRPHAQHILAVAITPLHIERVDPFTLRLRPRDGFLLDPLSKLLWSEHRPFHEDEQIVQGDMTVTVTRVGPDHRPLEITARFARPLEDPSYVWVHWQGMRSMPFTPPALGARSVLAGADFLQSFLGVELPFTARL